MSGPLVGVALFVAILALDGVAVLSVRREQREQDRTARRR